MKIIRFETERMIVRDMSMDDCDLVASSWGSPEVGKYMGDPYYEDGDQVRAMFQENELNEHENWTDDFYLVTVDKKTEEINGTACAWLMKDDIWGIGYTIDFKYWNQGLATELIRGLERFVRSQGGKALSSEIAKENIGSLKACYNNGFVNHREMSFQKSGTDIIHEAIELRKDL